MTAEADAPHPVLIKASIPECINYASWQNSVPLLRSLKLENESEKTLTNLKLTLASTPGFTRPKQWHIDRLDGSPLTIGDRDIELDPDYLNGLNEAERGEVSFKLTAGDRIIAESIRPIRVLARDEWGGVESMGELLAAFVMPNDPAVAKVLKTAAACLEKHGKPTALDGYQSGDPSRAFLMVAAIWSAIAAEQLTYANPPRSFEQRGQKIRRPATILGDGLATCLDTSLLFAAAIEAVGLHPVIVVQEGHCFTGAWLIDQPGKCLVQPDCWEVRKALASNELVTFETTMVTQQPPQSFNTAIASARNATSEEEEARFVAMIDIARARMAQILPLASHESVATDATADETPLEPLPLPDAPDLTQLPAVEELPTTAEGRIDRWQRKLLDLSLRNKLLNFRQTKQCIPILCPDIPLLEDRLAGGKKLKVISLPAENPLGERDRELHFQKHGKDLDVEFARLALERNEVSATLEPAEMASRLTTIYRKVRNDLAEGGTNTLFLAVGFLRWKQQLSDDRSFRAPLLLVPVKLTRRSARSAYYLSHHEDEVRFNATLIQLLKKDYDRDLSYFESNLPQDEDGIDVPAVLDRVRHEIRDIPGFEVVDESALSTFSFAKYLMWKDLVDRIDQLQHNRVVNHLINDPEKPFESAAATTMPRPEEIDRRYTPAEMKYPLPADSSQLAAVMAADEGHDFVLIGPPGTGKSQTITNLIAQCLSSGKSVLFVAEKTAALEVVFRRLKDRGIGDCCLELHSNKAERKRFLAQLQAAWEHRSAATPSDWLTISERLRVRRDQLNDYVNALHAEDQTGWSVFRAMGISAAAGEDFAPKLEWEADHLLDAAGYQKLLELCDEISLSWSTINARAPMPYIGARQWSVSWEEEVLSRAEQLATTCRPLGDALSDFAVELGVPETTDGSWELFNQFGKLADSIVAVAAEDYLLAFEERFREIAAGINDLATVLTAFHAAKSKLVATYEDNELERVPVEDLDRQWRLAQVKFWPLSWWGKRTVRKLMETYAVEGTADPEVEIPAIRTLQEQFAAIDANPLAGQTPHWKRQNTDPDVVRSHLQACRDLREAVDALEHSFEDADLSSIVSEVLAEGMEEHRLVKSAQHFLNAIATFQRQLMTFLSVSQGILVGDDSEAVLADTLAACEHLPANRKELQRWTAWCDVKAKAAEQHIEPVVNDLQNGRFATNETAKRFELGFVRWWLPKAIDRSEVLRSFQRYKHEDAIDDFRKIDDRARDHASIEVRSGAIHGLPMPEEVPRKSELGLLRHQMGLKRPSKSIREVISGMPESFNKLAPCLLMSPLSIAQYLPPGQALFDIVVFDEASQITTWDAVGAIARGRQTIIVGDPKQLPPTNFFSRGQDDSEIEDLEDYERDLESILDEAKASGLPTLELNWHYRSRHESLIAFSNKHYYGNNLVTFPSAVTNDNAVSLRYLPEAIYDRGGTRTNRLEAETIVADAVARMQSWLELPEQERLTLGVVTFNMQQQELIQDLFDQAQREHPELEWFFADDRIEPTVVKNLENVQGDERDIMLFSITFAPDEQGKFTLNFGALNQDGGERRLNVAITRARREFVIYSSITSEKIDLSRTGAMGVRDLKHLLEYAERGDRAPDDDDPAFGSYASELQRSVAKALSERGWKIHPQIGVSGFRVDLGVVHPEREDEYLAGIECDGATYRRSATARDRDKIREQVLRNLGWEIIRVWSPNWWYDTDGAVERIDAVLEGLLKTSRGGKEIEGMEEEETEATESDDR